jgi:t-SNARE complex subunit (syntaxin)
VHELPDCSPPQLAGIHQDILRIETQVNEILDLFVQFAILVREE